MEMFLVSILVEMKCHLQRLELLNQVETLMIFFMKRPLPIDVTLTQAKEGRVI
jgi:hypothetical protein